MARWRNRSYGGWEPYVPVARRRKQAEREAAKLARKGRDVQPVVIEGRAIARTFWGKAWCDNLEAYSDYENRLPRGRTYVRNGSVIDLGIEEGAITALVSGRRIYQVEIRIAPLAKERWEPIRDECAGRIDSLVDLLQGRLDRSVMEVICRPRTGLFPAPREISLSCSCPDWARMCKHVTATLLGVGARLDQSPELLFTLRGVDHHELIAAAPSIDTGTSAPVLSTDDISGLFGIELDDTPAPRAKRSGKPSARTSAAASGTTRTGGTKSHASEPSARPPRAPSGNKSAKGTKRRVLEPATRAAAAPPAAGRAKPTRRSGGPGDEAFVRSIRAGRPIMASDLTAQGIPHDEIQRWLRTDVLVHTGQRGVYRTTRLTRPALIDFFHLF